MAKKDRGARRRNRNIESHKLSADGRITDEIIIDVDNVYKSFRVYFDKGTMLKERFVNPARSKYENREILKGVSFQIHRGETVALIGNNGCGKSTTLKMLTKILYPNKGTVTVNGKVSSLIELGAGFHPDMSGRENIYINASILGLKKSEIDRRVDEIIRFSELEEFIDNPIRTYSSGMYMRLAFSVAINVDAEILLIDEILAVGDQSFQEKCINKLNELRKNGVTVVLVSHSMGQVNAIADRCIWIDDGKVVDDGPTTIVCRHYEQEMESRRTRRDRQENAQRYEEIAIQLETSSGEIHSSKEDTIRKEFFNRWKVDGIKGLPVVGVAALILVMLCNACQDIYGIGYSNINNIYPELTWKMWIAGFTLFSVGRIGVPLLLVVIGFQWLPIRYESIGKCLDYWKRNLLPLALVWVIWSFIYQICIQVGGGHSFNLLEMLKVVFLVSETEYCSIWIVRLVLLCVAFVPLLSIVVQSINIGVFRMMMIILWVVLFLFPGFDLYGQINGGSQSFTWNMDIACYIFYFCLGYLLSLYSRRLISGSKEVMLVPILLIITVVSQLFMQKADINYLIWYNYYTISLMAIFIFDIVARIRFGDKIMAVANKAYDCAVGIFLIHRPVQILIEKNITNHMIGMFAFKTVIVCALSFVISFAVIVFIGKIPIVGKYIIGKVDRVLD